MGNEYYHSVDFNGFDSMFKLVVFLTLMLVVALNWSSVKVRAKTWRENARHSWVKTREFAKESKTTIARRSDIDIISLPSSEFEYIVATIASIIITGSFCHCHLLGLTQILRNLTYANVPARAVGIAVWLLVIPVSVAALVSIGRYVQLLHLRLIDKDYKKQYISKPVTQRFGIFDAVACTVLHCITQSRQNQQKRIAMQKRRTQQRAIKMTVRKTG